MNELLLAAGSKAEPSAAIQGIVQNLGQIPGLPVNTLSYQSDNYDGKIYFGQGGRDASNSNNYQVWELNVLTRTCRRVGVDSFSSYAGGGGRTVKVTGDGSRLMLGGGYQNSPAKVNIMNIATGSILGYSGGVLTDSFAAGGWQNRLAFIGGYNLKAVYDFDFDTKVQTTWSGQLGTNATKGYWVLEQDNKLYLAVRGVSGGQVLDLSARTIATYNTLFNLQSWSDPVQDDKGYWWFVQGTETGLVRKICQYDLAANKVLQTLTLTGDLPVSTAYTGKDLKMCWHKGAIYFFRNDVNTAEGLSLYRII